MELRKYETIYLLRPDISDEATEHITTRLSDTIAKVNGKLLRFDDWGKRKTAYPVKKHAKAHFIQFTYAGTPGIVGQLERVMRMMDEILKYHSVKLTDEVSPEEMTQELIRTAPAPPRSDDDRSRPPARSSRGPKSASRENLDAPSDADDFGDDDDDNDDDDDDVHADFEEDER